jgi:hypothetical protein
MAIKTLALMLFLIGNSIALADTTVLKNGDFSSGLSDWEGDCHTPGSASDDSGATTGVVVKLRDGEWTKISQDFDGKEGDYVLTVTYTLSQGASFSLRPEDYTLVNGKLNLGGLGAFGSTPGEWIVIVCDSGVSTFEYWKVSPKIGSTDVQTLTTRVRLGSGEDHKKGFYLGFPPGSGYINLQSITLSPLGATAANP